MQAEGVARNHTGRRVNIGQIERVTSVGLGAAMVVVGLALRSRRGLGVAFTGAGLAMRGLGGYCKVYEALGIHGANGEDTTTGNLGVKVERSAPIDAPPESLYAFWRDFLTLQYNPPGGEFTHMVTQLFGEDPGKRLEEDLERLREAFGRAHEDRDGLQPTTAAALGYTSP